MPLDDLGAAARLAGLAGEGGAGITLHLFKSNTLLTTASTPADVVECDFNGYKPLTSKGWSAPLGDASGVASMKSPPLTFVVNGPGAAQAALGLWLVFNGAAAPSPQPVFLRRLDPGASMRKKGASLTLVLEIRAVGSPIGGDTSLAMSLDVIALHDTSKPRGNFRGLLVGLRKRISQVLGADERAGEAIAAGRAARRYDNDPTVSIALQAVDGRAADLLARQ